MKRRVLLTGFGPFAGVESNPSEVVVARLKDTVFTAIDLRTHVLDVSYRRSVQQVDELVKKHVPELVIHLGVARSTPYLRVEARAVNLKGSDLTDVDGERGLGRPVQEEEEVGTLRYSSFGVESLVRDFERAGFPAQVSMDAGRYVCNAVYYHSLRLLEQADTPCLFLHVPAVDDFWTLKRQHHAVLFMLNRMEKGESKPSTS